ncbi:cell division cycle 7-related protein kinase-like [Colias croceus]|uniref:cell division cycle 7-related protein kinase-like n=1 Tax=Colias crocea TaxID=72248 RepID=UPI001E27CD71|nr:cell division cycle 7-related protein kinase-like [Colias croceus]
MSRIRGIEAKILKLQKEVQKQQLKQNGINEEDKKNREDALCTKDDPEKEQIKELVLKLPKLDKIFQVHRKIGEGTFSSVYLGSLRQHSDLPDAQKRWFAIKHLVPTAHPARIEHELRCLQDMGGRHNVIGVELCLRHLDTIVFVMPYIPHRKFSEYVGDMNAEELARYMHALLVALRHVHSFGVIHRDVKPSNFLYDRENRRYLLVDFGLAQRVCAAPEPPPAHSQSTAKRLREEEADSSPGAKRVALDLSLGTRAHSVPVSRRIDAIKQHALKQSLPRLQSASVAAAVPACACAGLAGACAAGGATGCARRGAARAARAGTQGFRPPEVLLKSPRQGTALDTWAAGVVLASVLTARYPFFRASDDVSALAELADLLGTEPIQRVAASLACSAVFSYGRRVVVSGKRSGICLRKLARRLRGAPPIPPTPAAPPAHAALSAPASHAALAPPAALSASNCLRCRLPQLQCLCATNTQPSPNPDDIVVADFPESAFSLAMRLLDPDPRSRLSAHDALQHPFLTHLPH